MVDSDDADSDDPEYEPRPEWAKGELVSDQYTVLTGKLNIANKINYKLFERID